MTEPHDPERLAGQGVEREPLPVVAPLVGEDARHALREVEHREQDELGEREGVHPRRVGHDDGAVAQPHLLDDVHDARARELDPAEPRGLAGEIPLGRAVDVEHDLGLGDERRPLGGLGGGPGHGRRVIARIAGPPDQIGPVDDVEPRVDGADALDQRRLERRRDQDPHRPRRVTGGTWTRPATTASPDGDRAARGPDPRRAGEPRDVAVERRPVHAPAVPHLVELGRAVLGAAVVPEDGVAHAPAMPVDEVVARRPLLEMADQVPALGLGEPLDLAGPPADVERGPARARVLARDRMPHVGARWPSARR